MPNEATDALLNSNKKNEDNKSTERRNHMDQNSNNQLVNYNKSDGKYKSHTTQPSADINDNQHHSLDQEEIYNNPDDNLENNDLELQDDEDENDDI